MLPPRYSPNSCVPALPDFSALRVLVVGDLMIDRYLSGTVERISPEAPVPVLRYRQTEDRPGGAANVALNLHALGVRAALAGAVGNDADGRGFGQLLTAAGLPSPATIVAGDRPTTVKTRIVAQDQQLLRVDREASHQLDEASSRELLRRVTALLAGMDYLILQDYNKGVLHPSLIHQLLTAAGRQGVPVAVDPKAANFWEYKEVALFKPNLREMQQQLDFPLRPEQTVLDRAAAVLFERLRCERVMITLSQHGIYVHDGRRSTILPTHARRITDVSGAGDTVIAVAACALAGGMALPAVARLANLAGAQVIARPGVVAVELEQLAQAWRSGS